MANDTQFEPSFLKPIRFTYDLNLDIYSIPSKVDSFNFLERYRRDAFENDNSVLIKPALLRLPWPSAFQDARQCKYWREAKHALEIFLDEIYSLAPEIDGLLPNLHCSPESLASRCDKGQAAIDTAVSAAVYMNPEASPSRISLITKFYLLAWLHDDVVEHNPEYAGSTMIDKICAPWWQIITNAQGITTDSNTVLPGIAQELIIEDENLGRQIMKGLLSYTESMRSPPRETFSGFKDFIGYRAIDIASDFTFACVRFATRTNLTSTEQAPLQALVTLCRDHIILVNDLFSFDKERKDMESRGSTFINTVNYLRFTLSLETRTAKIFAQCLIAELELQIHQELERLQSDQTLSDRQIRYSLGVIESAAGNMLFSVTSKRYGGDNAIDYQPLAK